jgi:cytochrome c5
MKNKLIALGIVSTIAFACSKKVVAPVTEEVRVIEETKVELPTAIAEGKMLYETSCNKCHKLFPATKHDKTGWIGTLDRMAPKAKITDEQKTLVYNYLTYGM